jgi:ABC-type sugar transport system, permease component
MNHKTGRADFFIDAVIICVFAVISIVVVYPFINLMAISLNEGIDSLKGGIYLFPRVFSLENYASIIKEDKLVHAVFITVARTIVGTSASVFCCVVMAYTLSKKYLIGRKLYLVLYLIPMYVTIGLIPQYLVYKAYGLTNSFLVYIIPNLAWGFNIIVLVTFFQQIPEAIEESAHLEGANDFTVLIHIIAPLAVPAIATFALYDAVWHWNTWFDTVAFTKSNNLDTLMSMLTKMLTDQQAMLLSKSGGLRRTKVTTESLRAAMTMVTTIPIIMIYPLLQKYLIKGILVGGVKG